MSRFYTVDIDRFVAHRLSPSSAVLRPIFTRLTPLTISWANLALITLSPLTWAHLALRSVISSKGRGEKKLKEKNLGRRKKIKKREAPRRSLPVNTLLASKDPANLAFLMVLPYRGSTPPNPDR